MMISGILMIVEIGRHISSVGTTMGLLHILPFLFPKVFEYSIPLAILLGSLLTFSRMSAENEIHAMYTFRINFAMILSPVVFLSVFIAIFSLANSEWSAPWCSKILQQMKNKTIIDLALKKIKEEDRYTDKNFSILKSKGRLGTEHPVIIYRSEGDTTQEIIAENLKLSPDYINNAIKIELVNAHITIIDPLNKDLKSLSGFSGLSELSVNLSKKLVGRRNSELSFQELIAISKNEQNSVFARRKGIYEVHRKLSAALSCIFLGVLGMFMGLRMNTGNKYLGVLIVMGLVLIIYLPSIIIGKWLVLDYAYDAKTDISNGFAPWIGGWLPFVLLGLATTLLKPNFKGA